MQRGCHRRRDGVRARDDEGVGLRDEDVLGDRGIRQQPCENIVIRPVSMPMPLLLILVGVVLLLLIGRRDRGPVQAAPHDVDRVRAVLPLVLDRAPWHHEGRDQVRERRALQ